MPLVRELGERVAEALEAGSRDPGALRRDQEIFRLYFIDGLTMLEIASIGSLGLTASGVEKRLRKVRDALREYFLPEEGG